MLQLYGFIKRLTDYVMILVLAYTSVDCRNNLAEEKSILDNSIKKTLEAIINVFSISSMNFTLNFSLDC